MLSAIQIAGFLNQAFLQSKLMKQHHFFHVHTNSQKLVEWKDFGGAWSKMSLANAGKISHKLKDDWKF